MCGLGEIVVVCVSSSIDHVPLKILGLISGVALFRKYQEITN